MPLLGKTKTEVLNQFRTGEILEAARKIFARKGFSAATVDEIAEAAGVAKGTVYLYFPSKREIYLEALRQGIAALNEATRRRMDRADGIQAKLRAFIRTRIEYFEQNRELFKIYHAEFGNVVHPASLNKAFKLLYVEQAQMLEAALRDAIAHREVRPLRADAAALLIYDVTRGLITHRLLGWSKVSVDEDVEFLFDMIWKGAAGDED